ncbi:benzaldehyde dehydrogenase [Nocardioides fonticola]|uniref:Benzaldehyde dehydrogenase n=1 Tax=Nocardioides fonticola TaxID=450363 RepID=A0ABP7XVZ2_9ACTN
MTDLATDPRSPRWHEAVFTTGGFVPAGSSLAVRAPATGDVVAEVGRADAALLDAAVSAAARAQVAWAGAPYPERAAVFTRAAALLQADPDRLLRWLVPESGSAQGKAAFEVGLVVSELSGAAALCAEPYGSLLRSEKPRLSLQRRVPIGVVGVISPFNFPAVLAMRSVAPALAAGNGVVLKPDPRTPVSGDLFAEAGLPDGLLHVLPGDGELGAALVEHPGVGCLSFTGSTAAGRRIGETAGRLLKRVHLELGGNNALLILPDADLDAAVSAGAWGSFLHQGQICMTTGRHLVPRSLLADYSRALAAHADALPVGDPTDPASALGPLISSSEADRVQALVDEAVAAGATLLAGGTHEGPFYRPTVLRDVPTDTRVFAEEVFGPVAPIVAYDTVEEAIELINASEYGLSVGILTGDAFGALAVAERIRSGMVHINDQTVDDETAAPFGGVGASGVGGRFGSSTNLDAFSELQWVTMQGAAERYPF